MTGKVLEAGVETGIPLDAWEGEERLGLEA
jgi:hypothetical protein